MSDFVEIFKLINFWWDCIKKLIVNPDISWQYFQGLSRIYPCMYILVNVEGYFRGGMMMTASMTSL